MKRSEWLRAMIVGSALICAVPGMAQDSAASGQVAEQAAAVNINTADADTLSASLKGIGLSKARAIVEYREQNGPFKTVDELINVKGIGERSLEKLRPMITI